MLWVKSFHIIFMVTWFSGLFYLPRLFVYHAMTEDSISHERFKVMERKLYYGIMTPGAVLTIAFGGWMLYEYAWEAYAQAKWLHIKFGLILLLIGYHIYCGKLLKAFAQNNNPHTHVFYRVLNELPVFVLIGVVCLTILKRPW